MARKSQAIAEAVSEAWHGHHGSGRIEIPVGTVAALALMRPAPGADVAGHLMAMDGPALLRTLRLIWGTYWSIDPYLIDEARHLHGWIEEDPSEQTVKAVRAVAKAAIMRGLLDVTGHQDPELRAEEDVLGYVLTELRSHGARKGLGEYHTPPDVADMMARLMLSGDLPGPGAAFDEPAAGTGGLLRSLAQAIRANGGHPHDYVWSMSDVDPISAACCAVNAIVWGLGPNVLVHCGDTLREGDGPARAFERRRDVWAHHDRLLESARLVNATWRALDLLDTAIEDDEQVAG